jgi:hypothetical protein
MQYSNLLYITYCHYLFTKEREIWFRLVGLVILVENTNRRDTLQHTEQTTIFPFLKSKCGVVECKRCVIFVLSNLGVLVKIEALFTWNQSDWFQCWNWPWITYFCNQFPPRLCFFRWLLISFSAPQMSTHLESNHIRLYVGGLPSDVTENELTEKFVICQKSVFSFVTNNFLTI